jgi:hypothetical protein
MVRRLEALMRYRQGKSLQFVLLIISVSEKLFSAQRTSDARH